MKASARMALVAGVTVTSSTWASLPFYSPDYTFDSTTGTGFKYGVSVFVASGGISPDGKAANTVRYYESNVALNYVIAAWRGQTPLPTPLEDNDHINPFPSDINQHGWMCGITEQSDGNGSQPAVWRPNGSRIDLPVFPPTPGDPGSGSAFDMNDAGFVAGQSWRHDPLGAGFGDRPVYWTFSYEMVELSNPFALPNLPWGGEARSISSNGIIAGTVWGGASERHAMRWDMNGTAPILSQITDTGITFSRTEGWSSLDDGTILGRGYIGNTLYAILWTPDGQAIELRDLPNSTSHALNASEVNNNHYSVGAARNSLGQQVGVCWSPFGEPLALNRLADAPSSASDYAYDVNDFNFAVGRSRAGTYERAVLWTPNGDAIDMNSLIDSGGEWVLIGGSTITNTGWVSGVGSFDPDGAAEAYRRPFSMLVPFAGTYGLGDANFDEAIDFADLLIVAQNYGTETDGNLDAGDFNLDGSVNFADLLVIAQNYGDSLTLLPVSTSPSFAFDWQTAQAMVPEPTMIGGLIGMSLILHSRRR